MLISRPISFVHGTRNFVERNALLTYTESIVCLLAFTPVPCKFRSLINNEPSYERIKSPSQGFPPLNSMKSGIFKSQRKTLISNIFYFYLVLAFRLLTCFRFYIPFTYHAFYIFSGLWCYHLIASSLISI